MNYPEPFLRLMESFKHLPGIGAKSAERMVYHILNMDSHYVEEFADALKAVKSEIHHCKKCGNLTDGTYCEICMDESRDSKTIMVVERPQDVFAMEKIKEYKGYYHVLNGVVSMMDGISIDDLNVDSLLERIENEGVEEVIIATNLTREGETTALYLARLLSNYDITVSRIAHGMPSGGNIDYADEMTLLKSLEGRTKY